MPTYERVVDGQVVERSTTVADHPSGFDEQMAQLAADPSNGWRVAEEPPAEPAVVVGEAAPEQASLAPDSEIVPVESVLDDDPEED